MALERIIKTRLPVGTIENIASFANGEHEVVQIAREDLLFELVEVEKLSENDEFMKFTPSCKREKVVKALIEEVISLKIRNFYCSKYDPSFYDFRNGICFSAGKVPAIDRSYEWWLNTCISYNPQCNSRLGTRYQYVAFLGVLIKRLVEAGNSVAWAWNVVCTDSRKIGHYCNSENASGKLEVTGSREVCNFFDLANTRKILASDDDGSSFWVAGGTYNEFGCDSPIASIYLFNNFHTPIGRNSTAWLVLSED